jgi:hypothetical protein
MFLALSLGDLAASMALYKAFFLIALTNSSALELSIPLLRLA